MPDGCSEHVAQLEEALAVLGIHWRPDDVADDAVRAVMLAHAVLGSAEAHVLGAEIDAQELGIDTGPLREAYEPVRDELVAAAAPDDPTMLLLMHRAGRLLSDLIRAAGPDEEHPDSETLALTRDAAALVNALLAYHCTITGEIDTGPDESPEQLLAMAAAGILAVIHRLTQITGQPLNHPDTDQPD